MGLKIASKRFPDLDVFYDRKSGQPLRCETRLKDLKDGQEVAHVLHFSDHKEKDGATHFTSFKFERDGTTHLELELRDIKQLETLDDSVFAKPEK